MAKISCSSNFTGNTVVSFGVDNSSTIAIAAKGSIGFDFAAIIVAIAVRTITNIATNSFVAHNQSKCKGHHSCITASSCSCFNSN